VFILICITGKKETTRFFFHSEKSYDVTFIMLRFHSPRPESFAIFKKTTEDGDWIPFQFFSSTCEATYGKNESAAVTDDQAACTSDYTDISPLTGGIVPFTALYRRPSVINFDNSPVLQVCISSLFVNNQLTQEPRQTRRN
jgi:coxsackievirus/adenovirus receptor